MPAVQIAFAFPEPRLPWAPTPEPAPTLPDPLPEFNSRAFFDAPLHVRLACWEVEKVEAQALGEAIIAACTAGRAA